MRYVCLLALLAPALFAQNGADAGASIYKERCASCHDAPAERVPSLQTIEAMSPEAIYMALTSGVMKSRAEGMPITQLFALIGYIAPTGGAKAEAPSLAPTCKSNAALDPKAPSWNGWSPGLTNSRFQDAAAAGLTASDISKLKLKWAFNLGDVTMARAQPVVVGGRLFITSLTGAVYSLDASTGCTHWGYLAATGVRSGMALGEANGKPAVFFSDQGSMLYALNAESGELLWKIRPDLHFTALPTATPVFYKGVVYQAYSSFEEAIAADPSYACCTARGSVVALDPATGKTIWQTFTVPEAPKAGGPSGAGVWSTPTIDEQLGVLYVATGDNYSDPPTETSDAILAMDLKTGTLVWSKQLTANDAFTTGCNTPQLTHCPASHGPDFDFGQSPILVRLSAGKRALVIGQKSGMVHAIDPDQKGKILWQTRAGEGSALGGSQWGSASDGQKVFVAISDLGIGGVPDSTVPQGYRLTLDPKKGGGLHALDPKTGKILWSTKPIPCPGNRTDCSPAQSGAVTAMPGAVFSGAIDGHLRAYSASTGEVLWDTDTEHEFKTVNGKPAHGGSLDIAGPAIVNGMVYVNSGYGQWGGMPGNALLAFSVDGK